MTDKMNAMKESYAQYLSAVVAAHEGERSVELTFSPEPVVEERAAKDEVSTKGFLSRRRAQR